MENLEVLLKEPYILKDNDKEKYFKVKASINEFKEFIEKEVGWRIIITDRLIKIEKQPYIATPSMGIEEFNSKEEFLIFIAILTILEEMTDGEQFILSEFINLIKIQVEEFFTLDLTSYSMLKKLVNVLKYVESKNFLLVEDGESQVLLEDSEAEVLYENTGISRYYHMESYLTESELKNYRDDLWFPKMEYMDTDKDMGLQRRNRIIRRLLIEPYIENISSESERNDIGYLKNQKNRTQELFLKYLDMELQIYNNSAFLLSKKSDGFGDLFPKENAISHVILLFCGKIQEGIKDRKYTPNFNDSIDLKESEFYEILSKLKEEYSNAWGKGLRELTFEKLSQGVINEMIKYKLIEKERGVIRLLPSISRLHGVYPKDYNNE